MQNCTGDFFRQLQTAFNRLVDMNNLRSAEVKVKAAPLKPEEAIGSTKRKDYVLLKGKERLMQAEVMGHKGQAFTGSIGDYSGSLAEVLELPLTDDFQRAVYIAAVNAAAAYTGKVRSTVHCRNEGPEKCSMQAADFFRKNFGRPSILMIGYQPALAEALVKELPVKVLDLDPANIGRTINGVQILDGVKDAERCLKNCDVIFSTGSILCNRSIDKYYRTGKPLILYGTTGAGAAALLDIPRYCPESTAH